MTFHPSVCSDTNELIVKQGYVEKRGAAMLSGWKKRFIVLYSNNSIEYYTDDSKKTLQGTINIHPLNLASKFKNDANITHEAAHSNLNNVKHGFDIECANRTWKFRCRNDKLKQEWIDAIRSCIKQELIKPSANKIDQCDHYKRQCPDIYHCCLELFNKYDEWTVVWPLLKLNDKNHDFAIDEKKSDINNNCDWDHVYRNCDTNDKVLYLFKSKENRDMQNLNKAMMVLHVPTGFCNIYEYFPFGNVKNEYYCIFKAYQDKQYLFKCQNSKQRRLFIESVCERIYYQNDENKDTVDAYTSKTRKNCEFMFKYKPIHYHIRYICDRSHEQKLFDHNSDGWWYIPITVRTRMYKFILAIKGESSFAMRMSDLTSMIDMVMQKYFGLNSYRNAHDQSNSIVQVDEYCQINDEIKKLVNNYGDCAKTINEKDQVLLSRYGLVVSVDSVTFANSTIPVLNGIDRNYNIQLQSQDIQCNKNSNDDDNYNYHDVNGNGDDYKDNSKHVLENHCNIDNKIHDNKDNNADQFIAATKRSINIKENLHETSMNDLIYEVVLNGFEKDLCLNKDDLNNKHYSLLTIVNEKLQSKYYKNHYNNALAASSISSRQFMLALLLYTGWDCNYDFCKSQGNSDYKKWKHFDRSLYEAITCLCHVEDYSSHVNDNKMPFHLYAYLHQVQLKNSETIDLCYFPTYFSASYNKQEAMSLVENDGMLIQFDSDTILKKQFKFCSLEWVSKFQFECEIVIARTQGNDSGATMNVIGYECINNNKIQIVNVKKSTSDDESKYNNHNNYNYNYNVLDKNEKKSDEDNVDDDDDERSDEHRISNALVLIICTSKYNNRDEFEHLKSAKIDMINMKKLWEKRFNYTVITNEISPKDNEYFVDQEVLDLKINQAKNLLRDEKNAFDGFIFIYSGHGYDDGIVTSDSDYVKLSQIQKEFSPKKLHKFKDYPKIFIVDACRSKHANVPFHHNERLRYREIRGSNGNEQTEYYHPLSNMIEIFGNTRGYSVFSDNKKGGTLITQISKVFEKYVVENEKVFAKKTFVQLFDPIKKLVHSEQSGNQVVKIQDTLIGIQVFISPKRK